MKIRQIILKGVNNFEDFSYCFEDDWSKTIPGSILLMGPNGSGKSTLLKAISDLWTAFGTLLEEPDNIVQIKSFSQLSSCHLAAIEIRDFLPESLWICFGEEVEVKYVLLHHKGTHRICLIQENIDEPTHFSGLYLPPEGFEPGSNSSLSDSNSFMKKVQELMVAHQNTKNLRERFLKNRLGGLSDLPNMVLLESELRSLQKLGGKFSAVPERETFNWLAKYAVSDQREGSIENYLFTLKAVHPKKYKQIVLAINKFFVDKQIIGFDQKTAELKIGTRSGHFHPLHLLSSGEKQILLMIAFITRELRPGGVLLIDEPDLHLHVSLSSTFVSHLKQMVADLNGQLILASHAPELWKRFNESQKVKLGSLDGVLT